MVRQIEVHVETFDTRKQFYFSLWKNHAAHRMVNVRQRKVREQISLFDSVRSHLAELFPRHTAFEFCGWPNRNRFTASHLHALINAATKIVAFVEQALMLGH